MVMVKILRYSLFIDIIFVIVKLLVRVIINGFWVEYRFGVVLIIKLIGC